MDVVQKVQDLARLALHADTPPNEKLAAALGALRLIEEYKLLQTRKRVDVAASVIEQITSPLFVAGVAERAEQFASGVERVVGSLKRVAEAAAPAAGKRRRYRRG